MSDAEIAAEVTKVGGGHPSKQSIAQHRAAIVEDPLWYPGKVKEGAKKRGPKPQLTEAKKLRIARSAMALKDAGVEPSVAGAVEKGPEATKNPTTSEPFTDKYFLEVFRSHCQDEGADVPRDHQNPLQRTALPDFLITHRCSWAEDMEELVEEKGWTDGWFAQHVVWFDPCSSVIPGAPRSAFDADQAAYGKGPRWMSADKKAWSRNLRAAPYGGKQAHWGDKRVWWFPVVARGVVRLVAMEDGWKQTGAGMASFVEKLEGVLRKMFGEGARLPRVVFTDRGPGLYQASEGGIVKVYKEALDEHGFRSFAGDNAKWQPPDIPDVLPHERVVAWVRKYFRKHPYRRRCSLEQNHKGFLETLKAAERHVDEECDVPALCAGFLKRVGALAAAKGERLGK